MFCTVIKRTLDGRNLWPSLQRSVMHTVLITGNLSPALPLETVHLQVCMARRSDTHASAARALEVALYVSAGVL